MRTIIHRASRFALASGLAATVWSAGCSSSGAAGAEPRSENEGVVGPDAAIARQLETDAAELDRLRQDMVKSQGAGVDTGVNPPKARLAPPPPKTPTDASIAANIHESGAAVAPAPAPNEGGAIEPAPTIDQQVARLSAELAARLAEKADTDERPIGALLALSSLEFAGPGLSRDAQPNSRLTPAEADALHAWADGVRQAASEISAGATGDEAAEVIRRALAGALDRAAAGGSVGIARAALCTKVDGFGRYTEFPGRSVLAGRKQRAIVYVELDRFGHRPASGPDGEAGFSVELTQDLSLYHEADGLLAWRKGEQEISDFSRNRRRDFFVVQMIDLPETLTIGKYALKVRVRDRATGAEAEASLPIEVVAQGALLGR